LLIGAAAGWLGGQIVKGSGFGLLGNMGVGVAGAFIGGFVLNKIGVHLGDGLLLGVLAPAVIGAVILLVIVGFIKKW